MKINELILDRILECAKSVSNLLDIAMYRTAVDDELLDAYNGIRAIKGIIERALDGAGIDEIDEYLAEFKKKVEEDKKRVALLLGELINSIG